MKLTIELERATDMSEETWVSHCLELDAISQGPTPQDAIVDLAEAIDMMVTDEIDAHVAPVPSWERAFTNIAAEVAAREAKSADPSRQPTSDDIYALVREFTERLDRLGLAGQILVNQMLGNGAARIEFNWSGKSGAWLERESTQNTPRQPLTTAGRKP